jgi:hypothetical protein
MADLAGVIIGGFLTLAGSMTVQLWNTRQSRLTVRAAVRASIDGILRLYELRNFEKLLQQTIDRYKEGELKDWPIFLGSEELRADPILGTLGDKVGLLGAAAGDVVAFTNMVMGIDIDLRAIAKQQFDKLTLPERITLFENDLAVWVKARQLGQRLVQQLEHKTWLDGWVT